jgi:hypothetical protein
MSCLRDSRPSPPRGFVSDDARMHRQIWSDAVESACDCHHRTKGLSSCDGAPTASFPSSSTECSSGHVRVGGEGHGMGCRSTPLFGFPRHDEHRPPKRPERRLDCLPSRLLTGGASCSLPVANVVIESARDDVPRGGRGLPPVSGEAVLVAIIPAWGRRERGRQHLRRISREAQFGRNAWDAIVS